MRTKKANEMAHQPLTLQMADHDQEIVFELDNLPEQEFLLVSEDPEEGDLLPGSLVPVKNKGLEEMKECDWENDRDHSYFVVYMKDKIEHVPSHSGTTTVGCEKAISYLRRLDKEISEAIRSDEDDKIDEEEAEGLRDKIYDYISRLEEAREELMGKYKKSSSLKVSKKVYARIRDGVNIQHFISVANGAGEPALLEVEIVEPNEEQVARFLDGEGVTASMQKEASVGVALFEDPFMHAITRMLIEGHITHGRDVNELYAEFNKKYAFTPREELSIQELLQKKGLPFVKDLGRIGEDEIRPQDGLGVEHSTRYYS